MSTISQQNQQIDELTNLTKQLTQKNYDLVAELGKKENEIASLNEDHVVEIRKKEIENEQITDNYSKCEDEIATCKHSLQARVDEI
jgi:hypothetical protein